MSPRPVLVAGVAALALAGCGERKSEATPAAATGYRVYVTNERSGDLTVIDGAAATVVGTYPLGKRPRGVRVSPDGTRLYIALSGSPIAGPGVDEATLPPADKSADGIGVFDVASGKVVRVITGVSDPEQLAVTADGRLFITSEDTGRLQVVDEATGKLLASVPVGHEPEGVDLSPDGKTAWVTSEGDGTVTVVDTAANKPIKTLPVAERPRNTAFSPDGSRAYVSGEFDRVVKVIDTRNLTILNTVKMSGDTLRPMDVKISPDGRRLYVSTGRGKQIVALDAVALTQEGAVEAGQRPWGIGLSPDGKRLFSANGPSNDVSVIDTGTLKVVATLPAGTGPWGVAVVPTR
jgi:YVTN family beta-propeller protein